MEEIRGGVISQHSIDPDSFDDLIFDNKNMIDLEWEIHLRECDNEEHEDCYFDDEPIYLVGYKLYEETDMYNVDEEAEFSVIFNTHFGELQIVKSKYVIRNREICSPCFPNQIDLNNEGEFTGYSLPPDYLIKEMQKLVEEIK